jgi:hypothetical protein
MFYGGRRKGKVFNPGIWNRYIFDKDYQVKATASAASALLSRDNIQ